MDMTRDIGAGGQHLPVPLAADGLSRWTAWSTCNERATATQQTGFWFVAQARARLPGPTWASSGSAWTTPRHPCLTPIYCSAHRGPRVLPRGQRLDARIFAHVGILALQPRNQLRLSCVTIMIAADIRKVVDEWENDPFGGGQTDRRSRRGRLAQETAANGLPVIQRGYGPAAVRPLDGTRPVPARQIHRRQPEERTREPGKFLDQRATAAATFPTRSSSRAITKSGNAP